MTDPDRLDLALKMLRIARGMSQKDLAEASGVRNNAISKYESGKAVPKLDTLMKLTEGLSLPLAVVEQAKAFVVQVNSQAGTPEGHSPDAGFPTMGPGLPVQVADPALRHEIERVSNDAGRLMARYSALVLDLLSRLGSPPSGPPPGPPPTAEPPPSQ